MQQSILLYANIHKRAEVGNIRDDAWHPNAGFNILNCFYSIIKTKLFRNGPRIATRLLPLNSVFK